MTNKDLFTAMQELDPQLIADAAPPSFGGPLPEKKMCLPRWKAAVAACMAVVILLGTSLGGCAIAAEAAAYREAVAFFESNDLSTKGLSKAEIKAVHQDITQNTFSYEKTADVLNTLSLERYAITLGSQDQNSLLLFWENRNLNQINPSPTQKTGIRYEYRNDLVDSWPPVYGRIFCYDGETLQWTYSIDYDTGVLQMTEVENGVLLYGARDTDVGKFAHAFLLDAQGNLLWEYTDETEGSHFGAAAESEDGIALFGNGRNESQTDYTTFILLDRNGTQKLHRTREEQSPVRSEQAVRVADRYFVIGYRGASASIGRGHYEIVTFSLEGEPMATIPCFGEEESYRFTDLIYHQGKVWISAQKRNLDPVSEIREMEQEYYKKWTEIHSNPPPFFKKKRYTELIRTSYIATLFVCGEDGTIQKTYTAPGSVPVAPEKELSVDENGKLCWNIQRLDEAHPQSPYFSARYQPVIVTEFQIVFGTNDLPICKKEIGRYSTSW